jgi:hypothetical protein
MVTTSLGALPLATYEGMMNAAGGRDVWSYPKNPRDNITARVDAKEGIGLSLCDE